MYERGNNLFMPCRKDGKKSSQNFSRKSYEGTCGTKFPIHCEAMKNNTHLHFTRRKDPSWAKERVSFLPGFFTYAIIFHLIQLLYSVTSVLFGRAFRTFHHCILRLKFLSTCIHPCKYIHTSVLPPSHQSIRPPPASPPTRQPSNPPSSKMSRRSPSPTLPPIQGIPGSIFPAVRRPACEVGHSPQHNVYVKHELSFISTATIRHQIS
jgi:hypothetical protein